MTLHPKPRAGITAWSNNRASLLYRAAFLPLITPSPNSIYANRINYALSYCISEITFRKVLHYPNERRGLKQAMRQLFPSFREESRYSDDLHILIQGRGISKVVKSIGNKRKVPHPLLFFPAPSSSLIFHNLMYLVFSGGTFF